MRDWTRVLLNHHECSLQRFPDQRLLVLFDVDGTFLDMRLALAGLLRAYDAAHGSAYFGALDPDRKSTRLNSSHIQKSRMPSSA